MHKCGEFFEQYLSNCWLSQFNKYHTFQFLRKFGQNGLDRGEDHCNVAFGNNLTSPRYSSSQARLIHWHRWWREELLETNHHLRLALFRRRRLASNELHSFVAGCKQFFVGHWRFVFWFQHRPIKRAAGDTSLLFVIVL